MLVLEVVEEDWWKGRVGQKEGVFPSNFVEEITEDAPEPPSSSQVIMINQLLLLTQKQ